jgi:hypothetical protein
MKTKALDCKFYLILFLVSLSLALPFPLAGKDWEKRYPFYGVISTTEAKVWDEGQAQPFLAHQLGKIEKLGDSPDLMGLQGKRARSSATSIEVRGATQLELGTSGVLGSSTTSEFTDIRILDASTAVPVISYKLASSEVTPDPIDQLFRVDDYYGAYEGVRMSKLRDTLSYDSGWSMYMLGFNVAVRPGIFSRRDYQAVVTYQIKQYCTGQRPEANGSADCKSVSGLNCCALSADDSRQDHVRIYAVNPQRYSLRYGEDMMDYYRALAAGKVAVPVAEGATGWPVNLSAQMGRKYMEALEHIQRYPIISGFVDGPRYAFGWVLNPSPRITTTANRVRIQGQMLDDNYSLTAIVMVKDKPFEINPWVYNLSEKKLAELFDLKEIPEEIPLVNEQKFNKQDVKLSSYDIKGIAPDADNESKGRYPLSSYDIKGIAPEHALVLKLLFKQYSQYLQLLERMIEAHNYGRDNYKNETYIADYRNLVDALILYGNTGQNGKCKKSLEASNLKDGNSVASSFCNAFINSKNPPISPDNAADELAKRLKLAKAWLELHKTFLSMAGALDQDHYLEIKFKSQWRYQPIDGLALLPITKNGDERTMLVKLPEKVDRGLSGINGVWPPTVPGNQESWVSIKGQGFGNDLTVVVGTQLAKEVKVVSNDLILAKVPAAPVKPKDFKGLDPARIKVYTGGDALTSCEDCFAYEPPYLTEPAKEPEGFNIKVQDSDKVKGEGNYITLIASKPVMDLVGTVQFGFVSVQVNKSDVLEKNSKLQIMVPVQTKLCGEKPLDITVLFKSGLGRDDKERLNNALGDKTFYVIKGQFTQKEPECKP